MNKWMGYTMRNKHTCDPYKPQCIIFILNFIDIDHYIFFLNRVVKLTRLSQDIFRSWTETAKEHNQRDHALNTRSLLYNQ